MQALILAAGRGSRLGCGPKCLCEVGGTPLIEHQIRALSDAGIDSVTMVVGYAELEVRHAVGDRARFVRNPHFAQTNSLYSFSLARRFVDDELLVMNSDVLFDPDIVQMLVPQPGSVLAYDSEQGGEEEDMKVAVSGDRLVEMRKDLPCDRTDGENLGILRLDRPSGARAFLAAELLIAQGRLRDWLASAVNATVRRHQLRCMDVAGLPWIEIDFPADLERAEREVWPAIAARRAGELALVPSRRPANPRIPLPDVTVLDGVGEPAAAVATAG